MQHLYASKKHNTPILNTTDIKTKLLQISIIKQVQVIKMRSVKKERTRLMSFETLFDTTIKLE